MDTRRTMINDDVPPIESGGLPFPDDRSRHSYRIFDEICRELDFPLLFSSPLDFDRSDGSLRGFWEPVEGGWRPAMEPFLPSFIFDKASGSDPHCDAVLQHYETLGIPIFGPPDLSRLCGNKWRQYLHFACHAPLTDLLPQHPEAMVDAIHEFFREMDRTGSEHGNRAVVKPLHGYQSRGIHRISRGLHGLEMHRLFGGQIHGTDIDRNLEAMSRVPYLIQAWVDTSAGVPEVGYHGPEHDVRFIFRIRSPGKAQFVLSYLKTLEGMLYYPVEAYGPEPFRVVEPIADWIADHFSYGIFSVDVMKDRGGQWLLTELNDQVGLTIRFDSEWDINSMRYFMRSHIEEMKRLHQDFAS